jgi:hypothetical protein
MAFESVQAKVARCHFNFGSEPMTPQKLAFAFLGLFLVTAPCCGYIVFTSLQDRARMEAIPPSELPGQVVVYSAPG